MAQLLLQIEPFASFYEDAKVLFAQHWREVAEHQDLLELNPNLSMYLEADKNGKLIVAAVRDGGKLVGYILVFVTRHLHYQGVVVAAEDAHFLLPDYRLGTCAMRLFRFAEAEARRRGAKLMTLRTKVSKNHGAIFERMGYAALDITFAKRLDGV